MRRIETDAPTFGAAKRPPPPLCGNGAIWNVFPMKGTPASGCGKLTGSRAPHVHFISSAPRLFVRASRASRCVASSSSAYEANSFGSHSFGRSSMRRSKKMALAGQRYSLARSAPSAPTSIFMRKAPAISKARRGARASGSSCPSQDSKRRTVSRHFSSFASRPASRATFATSRAKIAPEMV